MATLLTREKRITVNSNLKRQGMKSDQTVVIKEISMDMPKKMIITAKTMIEFTELEQAKQLALRWLFFIGKDSMHVAMAMRDQNTWMFKDCFRMLLFTLLVGTTAHNLDTLLEEAGKTCVINYSLKTSNWTHCVVIGFESENKLEFAFRTEPIFGDMRLSWTRLDLVWYEKCEKFGHSALECNVSDTLVSASSKKTVKKNVSHVNYLRLAKLYAKKNVVSSVFSSGDLQFESGFGSFSFSSSALGLSGSSSLSSWVIRFLALCTNSTIWNWCLWLPSSFDKLVAPVNVNLDLNSNIVLDSFEAVLTSPSVISALGLSSSKILTTKVDCLESKLVAREASIVVCWLRFSDAFCSPINNLIWKFAMCNVYGINGFLGTGVAVIMNKCLVQHISKVEEIPDKILMSILGLYADAFIKSRFNQALIVNSLIAKAVNSSTFVVLGKNFNKNGKERSMCFKFCSDLGLVNSFIGHELAEVSTWSNSREIERTIDFIFVNYNLSSAVASHKIGFVVEFFDTDYKTVLVSIGLEGLVNANLNSLCKQANRDRWKFKIKDANASKWLHFREHSSNRFALAKDLGNLDTIWNILRKIMVVLAEKIFSKYWFSDFKCVRNKYSSKFFRLELLVAKIAEASKFETLINSNVKTKVAFYYLASVRKTYCKSKYYESRMARNNSIRKTINKLILDYLRVNNNLILDPCNVKLNINMIMEGWMRKYMVPGVLSDHWSTQYAPLAHIDTSVFSGVMCSFSLDELLLVVRDLPDGKAAGFSETLTNTRPIVLIKTAHKVLSKLLSDRISLACSRDMSILSLIFAVGSVVEDALEKGKEIIKMCPHFIKFFENIHNGQINHVMIDFGFTSEYMVHDGLDQGELDLRTSKVSFMATGAFVNNTIWIENSIAVTQSILNIASEFFHINNISINTDKTVIIPINRRVAYPQLVISESNITIAKRCKAHRYLNIFLSTEGFFHPSIAKAHLDLKFFMNLVLKKMVSNKQFLYLVSADKLLRKSLKLKANLPKNFSNKQLLAKNSLANFVLFANSVSVLSNLFKHHVMDLQVISWMLWNPFNFLITLPINSVDCFLAGMTNTLLLCGLSLESSAKNMFYASSSVAAADVLGLNVYIKVNTFYRWKKLDPRGLTPDWFISLVNFIESGGLVGGSNLLQLLSSKFCSYDASYVRDHLGQAGSDIIHVYINSSVRNLGFPSVYSDTAVYFLAAIGVGVRILSLLSSMLIEMQVITLVLDCIPSHIKDHTGVISNEYANFFTSAATGSNFILPVKMSHHFLSIEDRPLSDNAYHIIRKLYEAVNLVGWKSKYTNSMVDESLSGLIDKHHTFNVWHMDGQIRSGYTSSDSAILHSYFMKALYHQLPVAKRKRLYDSDYPSVLCIQYGLLEDLDHMFVCVSNVDTCKNLISDAIKDWTILLDVCVTCGIMVCSLHETMSSNHLYMSLFKDFMLKK
ncbi:hypothetical protein G9A89_022480 [Geosiphon pyriformis]|nr:hypothetical protein G9A89_022480 [Geosiphon pyriformis]